MKPKFGEPGWRPEEESDIDGYFRHPTAIERASAALRRTRAWARLAALHASFRRFWGEPTCADCGHRANVHLRDGCCAVRLSVGGRHVDAGVRLALVWAKCKCHTFRAK